MTDPEADRRTGAPGGPAVVAVGGGHGLSASLRAIRRYAGSVVAVVSVADDGGSSGRLRAERPDLPAPGDVRRCLGALGAEGSSLAAELEHRPGVGPEAGHPVGNLLLARLTAELGSFSAAVDEVARRVGAVGRVLPATEGPVTLVAHRQAAAGGPARVVGQVAVQGSTGIDRLSLDPADPASPPAVAEAILAARQVVLGPGSLFTSVLAAAVVPAVRAALAATPAVRVYVANLSAQVPETAGYAVADELAALAAHGIPVDLVVCDAGRPAPAAGPVPCRTAAVADDRGTAHHPERLAAVLAGLLVRPT